MANRKSAKREPSPEELAAAEKRAAQVRIAADAAVENRLQQDKEFNLAFERDIREPESYAEPNDHDPPKKPKKRTGKGDARAKLIPALTLHHKYENGSVGNTEPIGCNALAELAEVAKSTASDFFKSAFGGHAEYKRDCGAPQTLIADLKLLNNEFQPRVFRGSAPIE